MKARQIILKARPQGVPKLSDFGFKEVDLPALGSDELLLKPLFASVDPYMRPRMTDRKSYAPPFALGEPITGGVVAEVVESRSYTFRRGDKVVGMLPWSTLSIAHEDNVQKIEPSDVPLSYYLGILGMPGMTAYFGLLDICKPKAGETVVVSGAAGAVGLVVGQIAKLKGCRVIGIAGGDEKVSMLKDEYGFDEVINYKTTTDMKRAIAELCPQRVDCYFDNVGGDITDGVIANLNFGARIALCGQISLYNAEQTPVGKRILSYILTYSALMQGFIVRNYKSRFPEAETALAQWVAEGKLKYTETIVEGFDHLPDAFIGLFEGKNSGKMVVKI